MNNDLFLLGCSVSAIQCMEAVRIFMIAGVHSIDIISRRRQRLQSNSIIIMMHNIIRQRVRIIRHHCHRIRTVWWNIIPAPIIRTQWGCTRTIRDDIIVIMIPNFDGINKKLTQYCVRVVFYLWRIKVRIKILISTYLLFCKFCWRFIQMTIDDL